MLLLLKVKLILTFKSYEIKEKIGIPTSKVGLYNFYFHTHRVNNV